MSRLPPHYLFEMEVPCVFSADGSILRIVDSSTGENYLQSFNCKMGLKQIGSVKELNELYLDHNKEEISEFKKNFIERELMQGFSQEREVEAALNENRILSFIIKELMPAVTSDPQYKTAGIKIKPSRQVRDLQVREVKISASSLRAVERKIMEGVSFNGSELENILLMDKRIWKLEEQPVSSVMVKLGNQRLYPVYKETTSSLKKRFTDYFEAKLKVSAIKEDSRGAAQLAGIQKERQELMKLLDGENYNAGGVGFKQIENGTYEFYIETGDYALMSETGQIVHMGSAKIGVIISREGSHIGVSDPRILNNYKHPGLGYSGSPFCMGDYPYQDYRRRLTPKDLVLQFLFDCKRKAMMTYVNGTGWHNSLTDYSYRGQIISKREAEQNEIPITNLSVTNRRRRLDGRYA